MIKSPKWKLSQSSIPLYMILLYPSLEQTSYQHTKVFLSFINGRFWWYIQHQQQGMA